MRRARSARWPGTAAPRAALYPYHPGELPPHECDRRERPAAQPSDIYGGLSLKRAQKIVEKDLITRALQKTDGNRTHAARLLEISHPSLLSIMKAYQIKL